MQCLNTTPSLFNSPIFWVLSWIEPYFLKRLARAFCWAQLFLKSEVPIVVYSKSSTISNLFYVFQDVDAMKTDQWEQKFSLEMKTRLFTDVAQLENASVSIITLLVKHVIPVNQVLNHFQNAMNVLLKENGVLIVLKVSH